tara:strand:- start:1349 stop:1534 length:186 start_codon:yes stop_codon:yes gene_type:complete
MVDRKPFGGNMRIGTLVTTGGWLGIVVAIYDDDITSIMYEIHFEDGDRDVFYIDDLEVLCE